MKNTDLLYVNVQCFVRDVHLCVINKNSDPVKFACQNGSNCEDGCEPAAY